MATYLVNDEDLTGIADAIREKTGESDTLTFPADFESSVRGINLIDGAELDKKVTNMGEEGRVDCLALCSSYVDRTYRGITYKWNDDKTECSVTGTNTSTAISVNYFYNNLAALPDSIKAGETYYIKYKFSGEGTPVYFQIYYCIEGDSTLRIVGTYKEDSLVTIPDTAVGLVLRYRVAASSTVNAVVPRPKMFRVYDVKETDRYYERRDTEFSLIETRTVTDNSTGVLFDTEPNGTAYDFSSVFVVVDSTNAEKVNSGCAVRLNNGIDSDIRYAGFGRVANADYPYSYYYYITSGPMVFSAYMRSALYQRNGIAYYGEEASFIPYNIIYGKKTIKNVYLYPYDSGVIPAGAVIKVYAVRTVK